MLADAHDYARACDELAAAQVLLAQMSALAKSARVMASHYPALASRMNDTAAGMDDLASDLRADLAALQETCAAWERKDAGETGEPGRLTGREML